MEVLLRDREVVSRTCSMVGGVEFKIMFPQHPR